jgi:hypothetical protein
MRPSADGWKSGIARPAKYSAAFVVQPLFSFAGSNAGANYFSRVVRWGDVRGWPRAPVRGGTAIRPLSVEQRPYSYLGLLQRMCPDVAHCVDPGIDRQACYRRKAGHPAKSGSSLQYGVAQDREASQTCRLERATGCRIIGPRRTSSAHFFRPWRDTSVQTLNAKTRRFCA